MNHFKAIVGITTISFSLALFSQKSTFKSAKAKSEAFIEKNQLDLYLGAVKITEEFLKQEIHQETLKKLFNLDVNEVKNLKIITTNQNFSKHLMKFSFDYYIFPKVCYIDEKKEELEVKSCKRASMYEKIQVYFMLPIGNDEKNLINFGLKVKMISGKDNLSFDPKFFTTEIVAINPTKIYNKWSLENNKSIVEWKLKDDEILFETTKVIGNHLEPEEWWMQENINSTILPLPIKLK